METKLKHKLSRIFQTSFTSCRTKNISDVVEEPFFFPEDHHHRRQLIDLFSPKPQPFFSSFFKPKLSEPQQHTYEKRPKISDRNTLLHSSINNEVDNGRECPPVSPITPLNNNTFNYKKPKKSRNRKTRSRKTNRKSATNEFFASINANYYGSSWYSSSSDEDDDYDDDKTTLFSSRSFSSDSSVSFRKHKARIAEKRAKKESRNMVQTVHNAKAAGAVPVEGNGGIVTDSFAVMKQSSDPHNDFRTSMVEMIVEKQIFGAQELENLLQCFLSLNSDQHHMVIVEVFSEILEALFSDS